VRGALAGRYGSSGQAPVIGSTVMAVADISQSPRQWRMTRTGLWSEAVGSSGMITSLTCQGSQRRMRM